MKKSYWIQEQAPNGGWVNSVGLDEAITEKEAVARLRSWQKSFPGRTTRLVERTEKEVAK